MITQEQLDNFGGDKRSKKFRRMQERFDKQELKKFKELQEIVEENTEEANGVGDVVADVLEVTGIKKVAKALLGEDCGCEERQKKLNETFDRGTVQRRCFTEEEYDEYENFIKTRKHNVWSAEDARMVFRLYAGVFGTKYKIKRLCTSCRGTGNILRQITLNLDRVYQSLNN